MSSPRTTTRSSFAIAVWRASLIAESIVISGIGGPSSESQFGSGRGVGEGEERAAGGKRAAGFTFQGRVRRLEREFPPAVLDGAGARNLVADRVALLGDVRG